MSCMYVAEKKRGTYLIAIACLWFLSGKVGGVTTKMPRVNELAIDTVEDHEGESKLKERLITFINSMCVLLLSLAFEENIGLF